MVGTMRDARDGWIDAMRRGRDVWDSDIVRQNFRRIFRWIAALTAAICAIHWVIMMQLRDPHWRLLAVLLAIAIVCYVGATARAILVSVVAFVASTSAAMTYMAMTFGRDSGFHFPFLVALPVIAVAGRIGFLSKAALSLGYIAVIVLLDQNAAAPRQPESLDEFQEVVRSLNLAFVAIATCGLVLRYFMIVVQQQAELAALADTDTLTGLSTRRSLLQFVDRALGDTATKERDVSLIICDIDEFKSINDRYGHEVGDAIIQHVARVLSGALRSQDRVGRWGGEEFLVVLPKAGMADALIVAERLRKTLAETTMDIMALKLKVTITSGVANVMSGESFQDALRRADAALYVGKTQGKNMVVDADPHRSHAVVESDRSE